MSQKDLSRDLKLRKSTVERWYHYGYELRHKKILNRSCPRVLGLDEHSFNRKVGYATTFCDLAKHKIFDVVQGRSAKDLESYLNTLEGREKVLAVCIDLSSSYRSLIKRYFPNAKIVADRFHVIRLLNQMCLQAYQQLDPQMKHQRGLLAALRTNEAITDNQNNSFDFKKLSLKRSPSSLDFLVNTLISEGIIKSYIYPD